MGKIWEERNGVVDGGCQKEKEKEKEKEKLREIVKVSKVVDQ